MTAFFGWKVTATAGVIAIFAFGFGYFGPAVFLNVLHTQHGWPVSFISAAITVHFLVSALLVPYLPDAHDRFGIAAVTRAGVAALLVGVLGWSLAVAPWQLFAVALPSGAGWAANQRARPSSRWYRHGSTGAARWASAWPSTVPASAAIVFAPLWVLIISSIGFVKAVAILGIATLAILGPLIRRYLRPALAKLGLAPDGAAMPSGSHPTAPARGPRPLASAPSCAAGHLPRCRSPSLSASSLRWASPRTS